MLMLAISAHISASADGVGSTSPSKGENSRSRMKTAPMKANGSGVFVQFRVDTETAQVGKAVVVSLTLDGITDPTGATLRLAVDGGLSLGATNATRTLPAGSATSLTVEVMPGAEGVGYLHVFTTQYGATSATSIPIQVGKAATALPRSEEVKQTPSGDKIRPMPVK
ncbi:hypothetical protein [Variovorax sp. GT1P44]|uniref:hypothetical protein n=1 Tax=Variovorax sp. GT1P44 TaxID=3443742 RepID=UPI003F467A2E